MIMTEEKELWLIAGLGIGLVFGFLACYFLF